MGVLTGLLKWLVTPIGTYVVGAVVLLGLWQGNNYYQRQKGASEALVSVQKKTEVINEKARQARNNAGGPGAADRMRQQWCVDCR